MLSRSASALLLGVALASSPVAMAAAATPLHRAPCSSTTCAIQVSCYHAHLRLRHGFVGRDLVTRSLTRHM